MTSTAHMIANKPNNNTACSLIDCKSGRAAGVMMAVMIEKAEHPTRVALCIVDSLNIPTIRLLGVGELAQPLQLVRHLDSRL